MAKHLKLATMDRAGRGPGGGRVRGMEGAAGARRATRARLLLVAGIVFATVYLSWRYVVDLVAGATQAPAMAALVPALRRAFGGRPIPAAAAPDPAVS